MDLNDEEFEVCWGQGVTGKLVFLYNHCWLYCLSDGSFLLLVRLGVELWKRSHHPVRKNWWRKGKQWALVFCQAVSAPVMPACLHEQEARRSGDYIALGQESWSQATSISLSALPLAVCATLGEHLLLSKAKWMKLYANRANYLSNGIVEHWKEKFPQKCFIKG